MLHVAQCPGHSVPLPFMSRHKQSVAMTLIALIKKEMSQKRHKVLSILMCVCHSMYKCVVGMPTMFDSDACRCLQNLFH